MAIWQLTQDFIPNDILHAKEIRSPILTVVDNNNNNEYSLPSIKPSVPSILEVLPDGTSVFIDASSLVGNPDALINIEPLVNPNAGTVPIFDGTNAFNVKSQSLLSIDTNNLNLTSSIQPNLNFINTNVNNAFGFLYYSNDGKLIIDNQDNNQGTENKIIVGRVDTEIDTTQTNGNILLRCGTGLIELNGGVNIVGGNSNNNIYKDSGNQLILKGENNVYLNSSSGSTFIQSAGGNINLEASSGVINANTQIVLKNLGRLNVDTGNANLFTVSNDAGAIRLYSDYPITTQCNTSNINFVNDTGLFIKDRVSNFESNIKQQGDGDLLVNNTNGSINLNSITGASINSQTKSIVLDEATNKLTINNNNGASLTELISPNIEVFTSSLKLRSQSNTNNYTLPNPDNAPNDGDIIVFNSGVGSFTDPTIPNLLQSFYVSKLGSDTNNGSAVSPFLTITYALSQADLLSASTKTTIYILAGIYTEDFTISKNNLTLSGASAIPQMTVINGVVSYNIDGGGSRISSSLFGLTINGINLFGSSYNDNGSFVIGACVIGSNAGVVPLNILYNGTGVRDYTLNNTVIYCVDTNAVYINKGTINATACLFTETTTSNIYSIVEVVQAGVLNLFGCQIYSLNATASAPPVIRFTNSVATSSQFNSSTIGYAFGTIDTQATKTKVCVACQNSQALTLTVFNNKFDGTGSRIVYVSSNYVIISKAGAGTLTINYAQNIGTSTSSGVHHYPVVAGATRTQLITVI